jgi:cytochrome b561
MMSSAKNYPVSWFNTLQLPDLVAASESTYEFMHDAHETLVGIMLATVALHVAGALKHHFVDRDTVLRRMLPFSRVS